MDGSITWNDLKSDMRFTRQAQEPLKLPTHHLSAAHLPPKHMATQHDPKAGVDPTVIRNTAEELREALTVELNRASAKRTSTSTERGHQ